MKHQFVASGFIVTPDRTRALLIWHKKLQKWVQPGGHIDPDELPHEAALREVAEEVGVHAALVIDASRQLHVTNSEERQVPEPYVIFKEYIPATPHESAHIHIDLMYVMEHPFCDIRAISDREIASAQWFLLDEIVQLDTFGSVRALAHSLLIQAN